MIHQISQLLARLEIRDAFRWNLYPGPGLRVTSNPWLPLARAKAAEPADLYLLSLVKAVDYAVEDGLDNRLGVLPGHLDYFRYFLDQLSLRHRPFFRVDSGFRSIFSV